MSIGFKIKKLRENKNISQPELAMLLDISQTKLSNIENGNTKSIDYILMDKVCKFFDVEFDYFLENSTQTNNIQKNKGTIAYSVKNINNYPENLIDELKKIIDSNREKDKIINLLNEENKKLKGK